MAPALNRALANVWPGNSGPYVAVAFHKLLALIFVIAWLSLSAQVRVLIGERGLMPLAEFLQNVRADGGLPLVGYPSLLRWPALAHDGVLVAGTWLGVL